LLRAGQRSARPLNCGVMRPSSRIACLVAAGMALSGCFPLPHRAVAAPQIDGSLRSGGNALTGVTIRYGYRDMTPDASDCESAEVVAVTADDGRFSFQRENVWRFLVVLDRVSRYDVCAEREGTTVLLWSGHTGVSDGALQLRCDVTQPIRESELGRGRCDVTSPPTS
jgi:hypothetical protein